MSNMSNTSKKIYFCSGPHNKGMYSYTTDMIETDCGPERKLTIWPEREKEAAITLQECASVSYLLSMAFDIFQN